MSKSIFDATNFDVAIHYLDELEEAYTSIGSAGYPCLVAVIRPLRDRVNAGERTEALYDAIFEVSLSGPPRVTSTRALR